MVRLFKQGSRRCGEPLLCGRAATKVLLATTNQIATEKPNELQTKAEISFLDREGEPELQWLQQGSEAAVREKALPPWWWATVRQQLSCSSPVKAGASTCRKIQVNSGLSASAHVSFAPSACSSFLGYFLIYAGRVRASIGEEHWNLLRNPSK